MRASAYNAEIDDPLHKTYVGRCFDNCFDENDADDALAEFCFVLRFADGKKVPFSADNVPNISWVGNRRQRAWQVFTYVLKTGRIPLTDKQFFATTPYPVHHMSRWGMIGETPVVNVIQIGHIMPSPRPCPDWYASRALDWSVQIQPSVTGIEYLLPLGFTARAFEKFASDTLIQRWINLYPSSLRHLVQERRINRSSVSNYMRRRDMERTARVLSSVSLNSQYGANRQLPNQAIRTIIGFLDPTHVFRRDNQGNIAPDTPLTLYNAATDRRAVRSFCVVRPRALGPRTDSLS